MTAEYVCGRIISLGLFIFFACASEDCLYSQNTGNLPNIEYADALYYSGIMERVEDTDSTRIYELELYRSAVQEYVRVNACDSILTDRMLFVAGAVGAILSECKLQQLNGIGGAFHNACKCIDIWKDCLSMFHESLGKQAVDSLLVEKARKELNNWSETTPMYEYATKTRMIEPYWESQNLFATELRLICFMIREGKVSKAKKKMYEVINSFGDYGLLPVDITLYNMDVGFIQSIIAERGCAEAIKYLNDWYKTPGDYFSTSSVKIASEFIYYVANEFERSNFLLEAKDFYEELYRHGNLERDIPGLDPNDRVCESLFSLSNIHYETTRTKLAKQLERLNSLYSESQIFKEIENTYIDDYKNQYNYIYDCITLSQVYILEGKFDDAISILSKAEQVIPNIDTLGITSRLEQDIRPVLYNNMAFAFQCENEISDAIKYLEKSAEFDYLPATVNLGLIYYSQGKYLKAITNLEIGRQYFGVDGTDILQGAYAAIGEQEKAIEVGYECLNAKRAKDLELLFKMMPSERTVYPFGYHLFPLYIQYPETFGELCYDACLYTKSLKLHCEQTIRNAITSQSDLLEDYRALFQDDSHIGDTVVKYREFLDTLYHRIENNGGISEYTVTWQDVQEKLKKGEIAIEFFLYNDIGNVEDEKYGAVLIQKRGKPIIIKLPSSDKFQSFLRRGANGYNSTEMSSELFSAVFGQITPYMSKGKTVYFSPDGLLRQINIECLYTTNGKNAKLACNVYKLKRLSSTRELCTAGNIAQKSNGVLYGNLQYEMNESETEIVRHSYGKTFAEKISSKPLFRGNSGMMAYSLTKPLESTKKEVETISDIMRAHSMQVNVIEGCNGTEESFKSLSGHSPKILHIATHGFYLPEHIALREGFYDNRDELFYQNPLNRSGLILAGAEAALSGKYNDDSEDNILLASEIASMDLSNTNLVVLSACQTGLGDVLHGEVYGLQRGFKLAGVGTIIMSLWNVNDQTTEEFMTSFYRNLLSGKSKQESFSNARHLLFKKHPNHADYWAAFIMLD